MERKWWTLVGTCAGLFLLMLDSTVVALALPSIRHDVDASSAGLQWVMNGYLLAITVFVVTAGRLGDMFGRKRLFLLGAAIFAVGSAVSGRGRRRADADRRPRPAGDRRGADAAALAGDRLQRVPDGGAAAGAGHLGRDLGGRPGDRPARRRRPGRGRLAGDLLDQPAGRGRRDRRSPPSAAPESTDPGSGRRIDFPGLLALSVGLTAAVLALVQARAWSAGDGRRARRRSGLASLYAFWRIEHRVSGADRRLRALPQRPLLRRQRRRLRPGRRLLERDVLPVPVPAGRARALGGAQRADDPADHDPDGLHLAALRPPDRPLRRPPADDRGHGAVGAARPARPHPGRRPEAPTRSCWPATCPSGSPSASSTRRCRPRRWRRCPPRRSGSPPACWRWTG